MGQVVWLIKRCALNLRKLVVDGPSSPHELRVCFLNCAFPRLEELQAAGGSIIPSAIWLHGMPHLIPPFLDRSNLFPRLRRMHLVYVREWVFSGGYQTIDFASFPSVDAARVSFCDFRAHEVAVSVGSLGVGNLKCLVIEDDGGSRVPFDEYDLEYANFHPNLLVLCSGVEFSDCRWAYLPREDRDFWSHPLGISEENREALTKEELVEHVKAESVVWFRS
ncbi:hypothetical protein V5O48_004598 [Marasmius crinis-equi]|uniref:Uncharacterized protein n=1 Tax=Marasmius crinis-equi TaxID=585013 RepID=A0ABR3FPN0_9AGAR